MNQEILNEIYLDDEEDLIPRKRVETETYHKTREGEIIYSFLKGRDYPLLYIKANNLTSAMLQKGYQSWAIDSKLKSLVGWCKLKGAHPLALVKLLNRAIKELK